MPASYSLSPRALALATCHAARHPSSAVYGLLLGVVDGESVRVERAVPLFHRTPRASVVEAALTHVAARAERDLSMQVVGAYSGATSVEDVDVEPDVHSRRLAAATVAMCANACLLRLPVDVIGSLAARSTGLYTARDGGARWVASRNLISASDKRVDIKALTRAIVAAEQEETGVAVVYDFEEHLDDVRRDFWADAFVAPVE